MLGAEEKAKLELEHGPVVVINHPGDGSCFAFKRMGREEYELREKRVSRTPPDIEADDRLMQERCVWPSREAWNAYVDGAAFEVEAYIGAYKQCHGSAVVRKADADELVGVPVDGVTYLTNGTQVFGFRKPTRADAKRFRSETAAQDPKRLENVTKSCAQGPEFAAWLDANLFGVAPWADAFFLAFGITDLGGGSAK